MKTCCIFLVLMNLLTYNCAIADEQISPTAELFSQITVQDNHFLSQAQTVKETENTCYDKTNHVNWTNCSNVPSGRFPHNKSCNIFFTGEALLWKATEPGLEFALITKTQVTNTTVGGVEIGTTDASAQFANLKFNSDWGFRIGAGYNTPHDQWDFYTSWTRLHTSANVSVTLGDPLTESISSYWVDPIFSNIFPGGDAPTAAIQGGTGEWGLHFDMLDVEIGKKFFVGEWLALRPYAGLRGGWIFQKYNQFFTQVGMDQIPPNNILRANDDLKMKNNFRGIGIVTGLDSQWGVFKEVSLYADADVSLLYGDFKVSRNGDIDAQIFDPTGATLLEIVDYLPNYRDSFLCCRAIIDLAIGLKWDHMFANDRFHLGINAGWEEHYFFGQNQFLRTQGAIVTARNDLSISGWVFGSRVDF